MPFVDDCFDREPEIERTPEREAIELVGEERALLGRLARNLRMREADVVRLALHALARGGSAPR